MRKTIVSSSGLYYIRFFVGASCVDEINDIKDLEEAMLLGLDILARSTEHKPLTIKIMSYSNDIKPIRTYVKENGRIEKRH